MIVIDASVAIAWVFHEEAFLSQLEGDLAREDLIAPPLWRLEVLNILLKKERQRSITPDQANAILDQIDGLGVVLTRFPIERSMAAQADFARPHQLSAYDAAYVELAFAMKCPLMSFDNNQRDAAQRIGVEFYSAGG